MITTRQQLYLDTNTVILEGREGQKFRGYSMILKDWEKVTSLLPQSLKFLMLNEYVNIIYRGQFKDTVYGQFTQYVDLCELITMSANGKADAVQNCDLRMAKMAIVNYIGMLRRGNLMKIQCGTQITDRTGREFMAYSYKITDYNKAMELLGKVDIIHTAENCDTDETDESYNAMIEIAYLSLDEKVTREEIEQSMDIKFAKSVMNTYYDLSELL